MLDLEFSECSKNDVKTIVEIVNKAYRGEKTDKAWTSESHLLSGKRLNDKMLEGILKEPNTKTYIVKNIDKIVGTIQTKLENDAIHIGLFAIDTSMQSSGIGKRLLEFAESTSSKLWNKNIFFMEVISSRKDLIAYYNRRDYKSTDSYIEFPKSELWSTLIDDELKLLVLKKVKNRF
ncbi:GNAT family N-acetyltransferase [Aliarcobacter lanthieri]|uniref:GNAT family N-acetyltransferase n=1 Tax=Aliarcobacter lanthieri TaxID=1355374 RepID=UPI00047AF60D|nr:GNAT family N-acetyltransferase [Aliarcobacter lanthieri]